MCWRSISASCLSLYLCPARLRKFGKKGASCERRLRLGVGYLVGHEDGVDDVDDAIRLEDVGCGDGRHAALGVSEHDLAAGGGGGEIFALDGFEGGLAAALLDHAFELLGADFAGDDVVS